MASSEILRRRRALERGEHVEPLPPPGRTPPRPWHRDLLRYELAGPWPAKAGVYFAQAIDLQERLIKIGYAVSALSRITEWSTGCPSRIVVLGVMPGDRFLEKDVQQRFEAHRVVREWFRPHDELVTFIRSNCFAQD